MLTKLERWVFGWVQLAESLVVITTLGFVRPLWVVNYLAAVFTRNAKRWKREKACSQ